MTTCTAACLPAYLQVLYDLGVVSTKEPFHRLVSQGMILGEVEYTVHRDAHGTPAPEEQEGAVSSRVAEADVLKGDDG